MVLHSPTEHSTFFETFPDNNFWQYLSHATSVPTRDLKIQCLWLVA
jgi:hypothetical protein